MKVENPSALAKSKKKITKMGFKNNNKKKWVQKEVQI